MEINKEFVCAIPRRFSGRAAYARPCAPVSFSKCKTIAIHLFFLSKRVRKKGSFIFSVNFQEWRKCCREAIIQFLLQRVSFSLFSNGFDAHGIVLSKRRQQNKTKKTRRSRPAIGCGEIFSERAHRTVTLIKRVRKGRKWRRRMK